MNVENQMHSTSQNLVNIARLAALAERARRISVQHGLYVAPDKRERKAANVLQTPES